MIPLLIADTHPRYWDMEEELQEVLLVGHPQFPKNGVYEVIIPSSPSVHVSENYQPNLNNPSYRRRTLYHKRFAFPGTRPEKAEVGSWIIQVLLENPLDQMPVVWGNFAYWEVDQKASRKYRLELAKQWEVHSNVKIFIDINRDEVWVYGNFFHILQTMGIFTSDDVIKYDDLKDRVCVRLPSPPKAKLLHEALDFYGFTAQIVPLTQSKQEHYPTNKIKKELPKKKKNVPKPIQKAVEADQVLLHNLQLEGNQTWHLHPGEVIQYTPNTDLSDLSGLHPISKGPHPTLQGGQGPSYESFWGKSALEAYQAKPKAIITQMAQDLLHTVNHPEKQYMNDVMELVNYCLINPPKDTAEGDALFLEWYKWWTGKVAWKKAQMEMGPLNQWKW